jgi:hypothetical protein
MQPLHLPHEGSCCLAVRSGAIHTFVYSTVCASCQVESSVESFRVSLAGCDCPASWLRCYTPLRGGRAERHLDSMRSRIAGGWASRHEVLVVTSPLRNSWVVSRTWEFSLPKLVWIRKVRMGLKEMSEARQALQQIKTGVQILSSATV